MRARAARDGWSVVFPTRSASRPRGAPRSPAAPPDPRRRRLAVWTARPRSSSAASPRAGRSTQGASPGAGTTAGATTRTTQDVSRSSEVAAAADGAGQLNDVAFSGAGRRRRRRYDELVRLGRVHGAAGRRSDAGEQWRRRPTVCDASISYTAVPRGCTVPGQRVAVSPVSRRRPAASRHS